MIASVLTLTREDWVRLGIKDDYGLHKGVYSLFPKIADGSSRDFLFADKGGDYNAKQILMLSKREPAKPEVGSIESKVIPESFLMHDLYGFEIILNPVKRDSRTRKLIPITGKSDLLEWFKTKSPSWGFKTDEKTLMVLISSVRKFKKGGNEITHNTATFKGQLEVTDREMFIHSFENGIGKAKSFGFGLLQIIPLQK